MLGPLRAKQAEKDYSQVEVKVLGKDSQIHDSDSQFYEASRREIWVNGNTLWIDAIRLEMKNVRIAFKTYEGDTNKLVGYQ